jgi:predicted RNA-binding Zn-ribbon protein involved in translation (DUF1610 family)
MMIMTATHIWGGPEGHQEGWEDDRGYEDLGGPEKALESFLEALRVEGWTDEDDAQYEYEERRSQVSIDSGSSVWEYEDVVRYCFHCGNRVVHHQYYKPSDDPGNAPVEFSCPNCGVLVVNFNVSWDVAAPALQEGPEEEVT